MIRLTIQTQSGQQAFKRLGHVLADAVPDVGHGFALDGVGYRVTRIDWRCHKPLSGGDQIAEAWVTVMEWE